ncbi:TPA: MCE family protein [Escherichia coli]|nr:MCE family protein [Escherichia coli]
MSQETPASTTEAQIKNKRRISPFWLLPFIALMIAGWLIWDSYQDRGNTVTIDFMSADGIVPGRTPVRYQGVEVGTVQDISLSDDLRKIEVKVSIKSDMKDALREETQFWLVTPKASLAGVSGLDALVGGNYIGMMPGKGKEQDHFVALDTQPKYRLDNGDLMIHLQAPDLGSLSSGSLVYFRKIPVGKVYDYAINPNKQGVVIDVLIERRFTDLVKKGSRFWNVSGVDANVSISGAKVKLESLAALVNGAIAFDSPEESKPAEAEDTFGLYEDLAHSQRGVIIKLELPGGAGLTADSTPLMYQGLEVGTVTGMTLGTLSDRVMIAMRISKRYQHLVRNNSVFWLASGYSLDFGLTGGVVKTGTFNQFIRGGIAFATPPGTPLAPKAQEGKHFLLQESEPKEWREWGTALPK